VNQSTTPVLRRHDIDALRVIAIGLLLLYHVAIGFQPWGVMIGFIASKDPLPWLWPAMAMLNVWRIPLLFFVSGMGVYFAIRNRTWNQLLKERVVRIIVPFVFGIVAIVPIHVIVWQLHYGMDPVYRPGPGHLWFLGNIFSYVLILSPLFVYLKANDDGWLAGVIKKVFSTPLGLLVVIASFMSEAYLLNPVTYEMYAFTWHGFALGFLAFLFGFCFVFSGDAFWNMIVRWRWVFVTIAVGFYIHRLLQPQMRVDVLLKVLESNFWMFTVFAFGWLHLSKSSPVFRYLSEAAYPVYIVHMIFLYLFSLLLFPLNLNSTLTFILVLIGTVAGSLLLYELVIKRVGVLRYLFGLKRKQG